MKFFKYGQKGFTLIELLVVIAILGTLAGVVVLNVIQFIGKGACEAGVTEYHNVQTACVAAAYSAGDPAGIDDIADCEPYLLTHTKYTWEVEDGVVASPPGNGPNGDVWPTDCTP